MSFETRVREEWPALADQILDLVQGRVDPDTYPSVATWVAQCYHPPSRHARIACALNEVLDGSGVEAIYADEGSIQPVAEYINLGDTYTVTLLYRCATAKWRVCTWGDYVEARDAASA